MSDGNEEGGAETASAAAVVPGVAEVAVQFLFSAAGDALLAPSLVGDQIQRPALLFRTGDYPDKGCIITRADLDGLVVRFHLGGGRVPVIQEHREGPLDPLGHVVGLYRNGDELWGMLSFSPGIHAHLEERGVQNLSVALVREVSESGGGDGQGRGEASKFGSGGGGSAEVTVGVYRLKEASLVWKARVPGAGFRAPEQTRSANSAPPNQAGRTDREDSVDKALVEARLAQFRAGGKVTPAMEEPLRGLLRASSGPHSPSSSGSDNNGAAEITRHLDALLFALPVVQARGASVPRWFGGGGGGQVSGGEAGGSAPVYGAATETVAQRLGIDPARLAAKLGQSTEHSR